MIGKLICAIYALHYLSGFIKAVAIQEVIRDLESRFDLVTGLTVIEIDSEDFKVTIEGFQSGVDRRTGDDEIIILIVVVIVKEQQ